MAVGRSSKTPSEGLDAEARAAEALALIRKQHTMVIATVATGEPWAAPVYYVYSAPYFYFFSSPRSRHIENSLIIESVAAAIFADSSQWEEIQGLQMSGNIKPVTKKTEQLRIGARFILKFPFAEAFLQFGRKDNANDAAPRVGDRVQLYAFIPKTIYFVNNRLGFGKRTQVTF